MACALEATHLKLSVVDLDDEFVHHAQKAFAGVPDTEVILGPFDAAPGFDCMVAAGNTVGEPIGNLDQAILRFFGPALEYGIKDCILKEYGGEQPVGTSCVIATGHPDHPFVAHTPCYPHRARVAYDAMKAMLQAVRTHNEQARSTGAMRIRHVACTGLGTFTGNRHSKTAAEEMSQATREFFNMKSEVSLPGLD